MTPRVWIERPIESVEDAEALPVGTVAIDPEHTDLAAATTYGPGRAFIRTAHWEASDLPWHSDDDGAQWHDVVVGMTALVPVEAVEEISQTELGPVRRWQTAWDHSRI